MTHTIFTTINLVASRPLGVIPLLVEMGVNHAERSVI